MPTQQEYNDFVKRIRKTPPVECSFVVGDPVTYMNEYGVSFDGYRVIGFADDDGLNGRFIYLNKSSWWFPVKPSELTLVSNADAI